MGDWKRVLDFIAMTESISVINVLLVLNPKHSSYWEEKITLSQLKAGQYPMTGHVGMIHSCARGSAWT